MHLHTQTTTNHDISNNGHRSSAIYGTDPEAGPQWNCTPAVYEGPPAGYDPDFEPLCLHASDKFVAEFVYQDLITGKRRKYEDMFTLNIVGSGKTWKDLSYMDSEKIATVNPLCGETEEEKKKYVTTERILYLNSDAEASK